jgi:hypothetical protein
MGSRCRRLLGRARRVSRRGAGSDLRPFLRGKCPRQPGVRLRRKFYLRVAKNAAMTAGCDAHAKQFKRHRREIQIWTSIDGGTSA